MKKLILLYPLLIFACSSVSEGNDDITNPNNSSAIKIMPLGASRVEGGRPNHESYRFYLWKNLKETNFVFDFVGTQYDEATYPSVNGEDFDADHEGRGGWTSGDILDGLEDWLDQLEAPNIVLISSPGGNDGLDGLSFSQAVSNINLIVDILQENNPSVTIIIEQMAPARSDIMTDGLTNFFYQMHHEVLNISTNKSTASSNVIPVNMHTGFTDNLLADDVHYNIEGAKFIAERYLEIFLNEII